MTETRLTRSRPKNPPAKTVAEAEKVKRARSRNRTRRRPKNMTTRTRLEDLPPLARKYVEENELKLTDATDRPVTPAEMGDLEGQVGDLRREREAERDLRLAGELDAKATTLMNADPNLDYGSAMRAAVANDGRFARNDEPDPRIGQVYGTDDEMREAVERRMKADPANYATDEDEAEEAGSVHAMGDADYQRQMKEAMERRGYDLD